MSEKHNDYEEEIRKLKESIRITRERSRILNAILVAIIITNAISIIIQIVKLTM